MAGRRHARRAPAHAAAVPAPPPPPGAETAPAPQPEAGPAPEEGPQSVGKQLSHVPALSPEYKGPNALPPVHIAASPRMASPETSSPDEITRVMEPPPAEALAPAGETAAPRPAAGPPQEIDFDATFERLLADYRQKNVKDNSSKNPDEE
jgi:hypothetical protein